MKEEQKLYKLNFSVTFKDIDGNEVMELRPGIKIGSKIADLKEEDYIPQMLNKILARSMASSTEDFGGRVFEWYQVLYNKGILELSEVDCRVIKDFIESKRKDQSNPFSNILINQFNQVFNKSGYKN